MEKKREDVLFPSSRFCVLHEINAGATLAIQKTTLEAPETHTGSATFAGQFSRTASADFPTSSLFNGLAGYAERK